MKLRNFAPNQDMKLTFVGQGYVEDVSWELPPSDSSPEGAAQDDSDVLRLGETCIWTEFRQT